MVQAPPQPQTEAESLVSRIVAELQANPEAQQMLLRALLTEEFLAIPTRLDRIEADVAELKRHAGLVDENFKQVDRRFERVDENFAEVNRRFEGVDRRFDGVDRRFDRVELRLDKLENDVGELKGDNLEFKLSRKVRPLLSQRFELRRARVMQSVLAVEDASVLSDAVDDAYESGLITFEQETRLVATDLIMRAQRRSDRAQVWIAIEASSTISDSDIRRARQSADALSAVFGGSATMAVVVGYSVEERQRRLAAEMGVEALIVAPGS